MAGERVARGRRRAEDHLDEIAQRAAAGALMTQIAEALGLTYRQVVVRQETLRRKLAEETGDLLFMDSDARPLTTCAQRWCSLRGLAVIEPA